MVWVHDRVCPRGICIKRGLQVLTSVHPRMARSHQGPTPTESSSRRDFLLLNYGAGTPLATVTAHLIYGGVLGVFYYSTVWMRETQNSIQFFMDCSDFSGSLLSCTALLMKKYWIVFILAVVLGASFFSLPYEQRQEVAKYIAICLLSAFILRQVGLTIGQILRKLLSKE